MALLGLLLVTVCLRLGGLALIHDRGDQLIWAALARNAAARGLEGYTIRGIDTAFQVVPGRSDVALWRSELAPLMSGSEGNGTLVTGLSKGGERYWDAPLANQPPGYTALLVGSHALLASPNDGWPLVGRTPAGASVHPGGVEEELALAQELGRDRPRNLVRAQLWATFPPLASDVITVALLWLAGVSLLGSRRAAIVIALAYATDPLALFASHRVLSNATLATVSLGAILLWARADARTDRFRGRALAFAGLVAGFAIATKVSAIFLLPAVFLVSGALRRQLVDKGALVFVFTATILNAPWWTLAWRLLGNPFGMPWEKLAHWTEESDWGKLVTDRGLAYYPQVLFSSPVVLLGALGSLGVVGHVARRAIGARGPTPGETERSRALALGALFGLLVIVAAQFHSGGKEARHILLAYPAFLLVVGAGVEPLRRLLKSMLRRAWSADLLLVAALGLVFFLQARVGLAHAYDTAGVPP